MFESRRLLAPAGISLGLSLGIGCGSGGGAADPNVYLTTDAGVSLTTDAGAPIAQGDTSYQPIVAEVGVLNYGQSNSDGSAAFTEYWQDPGGVNAFYGGTPVSFLPGCLTSSGCGSGRQGPEMWQGKRLNDHGKTVYTAKAALSGSALSECLPGGDYNAQFIAAVAALHAALRPASVLFIVQMQGEQAAQGSPSLNEPNGSLDYQSIQTSVFAYARSLVPGRTVHPVVIGTNLNLTEVNPALYANVGDVHTKQQAACVADGNASFLAVDDIHPATVHYDQPQIKDVGQRSADLILSLL